MLLCFSLIRSYPHYIKFLGRVLDYCLLLPLPLTISQFAYNLGTPMALKFFLRESTSLLSFLREYNLSLAFCTHPSLTSAMGIAFSTPTHYVFAQQPCLYGDLYDVIVPEVGKSLTSVTYVLILIVYD